MKINFILWLCVIWMPVLICGVLRNEAKMKKNIIVGVTLPYEARADEEVQANLKRFKRAEIRICLLMILAGVPGMFIRDFGWLMFIWGIWIIASVAAPYLPYIRCNRNLKAIKRERGWVREKSTVITVNTAAITPMRWISPAWFVIPLVASVIPLLWEQEVWFLYLVDALSVLACWLMYRFLYRNKAERVDDNVELTRVLTEVRRKNWGRMCLVIAYPVALISIAASFFWDRPMIVAGAVILVAIGMTAAAIGIEFHTRNLQQKLTEESGKDTYIDEDDCWIWGLVYYNPQDTHFIVNDRTGTNVSFNMARPLGKSVMLLVTALLLIIPFMVPITEAILDRPPELAVQERILTASSGGTKYEIALDEVQSVALRKELPDKMVRVMGTGMEHLLTGKFKTDELGKVQLCLDPTCDPYILIETKEGARYLFGTRDPKQTEHIYQMITEELE